MDEMEEKELLSEAARLIAARRHRVQAVCPVCGATFEGTKRKKYDKPSCAAKAFYDANRERVVREKRQRRAARSSASVPAPPASVTGPASSTPAQ